jgi:ferredoxin
MKLVLDQTACQGYGLCSPEAPDLVDLDDWGYAGLLGDGSVPSDRRAVAHTAAAVCPVAALRVQP